jgi:hypothetical protein
MKTSLLTNATAMSASNNRRTNDLRGRSLPLPGKLRDFLDQRR